MVRHPDIENRIKEIGSEIISSMEGEVPSFFDTRTKVTGLMEWAMRDDAFRIQLLRFIDVLPSLKDETLMVKILKEYFSDEEIVPMMMRWGLKEIPEKGVLSHLIGKVIRDIVESLARQFIVGKDPEDALETLHALRKERIAFSIDLLGEVVVSDREAEQYADRYLNLLDFLHPRVMAWEDDALLDRDHRGRIPRLDISLKVSSLYSQLDPLDWEGSLKETRGGLRPIFEKAKECDASVVIDMEHYYFKDLTIAIFQSILEEAAFQELPFTGISIQTYLKDTNEDLLKLIQWTERNERPITVRLVKGAYWDYEAVANRQKGWPVPVIASKEETDHNYEKMTCLLLEIARFIRPAFATHNIRSISHAIAAADALNIPREAIEFQMLYGMAEPIRRALEKMNLRVRVYTPIGELLPGMAYLVRRLLENISNESFLRKSFFEKTPFEELMKTPAPEKKVEKPPDYTTFGNEPPMDFSKKENREKMTHALKRVRSQLGRKYPLFIGNEKIETGRKTHSINPARPDEIIGSVSFATEEEAEKAVEEARKVWLKWRSVPHETRAEYLFKAAREMRKMRFELTALEVLEVGKTWKEADGDVAEAIDYLEYYGREMVHMGIPQCLGDYPGEENSYLYEPKGVGVVLSPWNFPLAIPTGMISAGIVTGNCVIFKPSGLAPVTGWKIVEIFDLAGIPPGVLQFLPGSGEDVGEYLVSHPGIDFIAFTGSRDAGLRIVQLAGETLAGQRNVKRVIAEMGGKNAIIVDDTADLDEAVKGVLESALGYQGQKCSACSRVIVEGEAFDGFCRRLKDAMESIKVGNPEEPWSFMGPVVSESALAKVRHYMEIGKKEGKVLLMRRMDDQGYFVGPALFGDIHPDSRLAMDEIFGPVLTVMRAEGIDEAIDIANNSLYALTGGVFSRSPATIQKVKEEMRVGNLYINRKITGALVGRQPFGGFGLSGVGSKAGGPDYLRQFMNPKSISENTVRKGFAPIQPETDDPS
jgi:RHH-type proline utilization regulon transcriptional repressor/proline dehydrogenase/delta 1-pyrroline-5-carboxylate dehydrogenase